MRGQTLPGRAAIVGCRSPSGATRGGIGDRRWTTYREIGQISEYVKVMGSSLSLSGKGGTNTERGKLDFYLDQNWRYVSELSFQ